MRYLRCEYPLRVFAFSPDSTQIAGVDMRGTVWMWNCDRAWPIATAAGTNAYRVAFSADGSEVYSWGYRDWQRWRIDKDGPSPTQLIPVTSPFVFPTSIAGYLAGAQLDSKVEHLFAGGWSTLIRWDTSKCNTDQYTLPNTGSGMLRLALPPGGDTIVIGGWISLGLALWKLSDLPCESNIERPIIRSNTGLPNPEVEPIWMIEAHLRARRLGCTASGDRLLMGAFSGWELRRMSDGEQMSVSETGADLRGHAISPDGRIVLASTLEREVIVYDADTAEERERFRFNVGQVSELEFAPDGLTAAACGGTKRIAIWDVE